MKYSAQYQRFKLELGLVWPCQLLYFAYEEVHGLVLLASFTPIYMLECRFGFREVLL